MSEPNEIFIAGGALLLGNNTTRSLIAHRKISYINRLTAALAIIIMRATRDDSED
ncbi:hypothetical protein [Teredinibacter purpureus]|uniref:hypothetical protein n=1 Tax=Teredinibacter purpureus TaxID=2731756 RepID=UPI0013C4ED1F|nr:hypothetical protein [Teredinibacter purpureus]